MLQLLCGLWHECDVGRLHDLCDTRRTIRRLAVREWYWWPERCIIGRGRRGRRRRWWVWRGRWPSWLGRRRWRGRRLRLRRGRWRGWWQYRRPARPKSRVWRWRARPKRRRMRRQRRQLARGAFVAVHPLGEGRGASRARCGSRRNAISAVAVAAAVTRHGAADPHHCQDNDQHYTDAPCEGRHAVRGGVSPSRAHMMIVAWAAQEPYTLLGKVQSWQIYFKLKRCRHRCTRVRNWHMQRTTCRSQICEPPLTLVHTSSTSRS